MTHSLPLLSPTSDLSCTSNNLVISPSDIGTLACLPFKTHYQFSINTSSAIKGNPTVNCWYLEEKKSKDSSPIWNFFSKYVLKENGVVM